MPELQTVTITINGMTYTHTGTLESIKYAQKKLKDRLKVKLTEQEQREVTRNQGRCSIASKEEFAWVWKVYRQARIDKNTEAMFNKIRAKFGCTQHRARQLVANVRRSHAVEIRTKRPEEWSIV